MWNANMTAAWLAGFTVCFSLIISIGAQNLYVLRQAVKGQHVRACVAWCVISDAVLIGLGLVAGHGRRAVFAGLWPVCPVAHGYSA